MDVIFSNYKMFSLIPFSCQVGDGDGEGSDLMITN